MGKQRNNREMKKRWMVGKRNEYSDLFFSSVGWGRAAFGFPEAIGRLEEGDCVADKG